MAQWLTSEKYGNGSDGAYAPETGTDAPVDSSCSGTATETALTATNASFAANNIILIHQSRGTGVGQWELNVIESYTAGTITTKYALAYTYTDSGASQAQVLVLKQYSSALIDTGVTLTTKDWTGDVGGIYTILCDGVITVTGDISANGRGFIGGAGGAPTSPGSGIAGTQGESPLGAGAAATTSANGSGGGGGGGGGDAGAGGGGGGHAASGTTGEAGQGGTGGIGGGTDGNASLTDAVFGGGGGGGGGEGNGTATGGAGGDSGGFVLLIGKTITVTGGMTATGVAGSGGATGSGDGSGGGGGGSGGAHLFKGQKITLGESLVTSTAGAGGTEPVAQAGVGGAGAVGRIAVYYGTSYTGDSNPAATFTEDSNLITTGGAFLYNMI